MNTPTQDKICPLNLLGRTKRRKADHDETMEEAVHKKLGGDDMKEVATWVERKLGRLEPTKGTEKGEDEQERESDPGEEDD